MERAFLAARHFNGWSGDRGGNRWIAMKIELSQPGNFMGSVLSLGGIA